MAAQAEAEREKRAKVINAEGEFQAAERLTQAAALMSSEPGAMQLRYLQSMREIASERSSMTILPIPIDLLSPFINLAKKLGGDTPETQRATRPPVSSQPAVEADSQPALPDSPARIETALLEPETAPLVATLPAATTNAHETE